LDDFEDFYKEFGVKFDRLYFESEAEDIGKNIVLDMMKNGLAEKDEGAIIIKLEEYGLGVFVLLTKDNNALYSTKDLGLAELKSKEFKFDKSIHITGAEQKLHFEQLFKTFEIIKSPLANKSLHIPYGLVTLPEGKISSRLGTPITVALALPVGVGGAAIVTVGTLVKLLPTFVIITSVTALPNTMAVAVAGVTLEPPIATVGADV
jgi:arginyl-tRNA synthetase